MDKNEFLKMLDLDGKESTSEETTALTMTSEEKPSRKNASPTALELDEWALRRGRDLLAESDRLQALKLDENAVADFHACAFETEPTLKVDCADRKRRDFIEQLFETPDYHALHCTTMLRETAAAIASTAFAEQFAALNKEKGPEEKRTEEKEAFDEELSTLRAAGRAVSKACAEVGEAADVASALGLGPGTPGSNEPRTIAALYRRVRENSTLRRICELAGRYRRVAQSKQRRKTTHGMDDMVGVVLDGDLGRLLPSELARLILPETEDDTLRRLVERQTQCREYHATEPVGKGPILCCVDESGSMQGEKGHMAKALVLALAWIARQQRRWCALVAYSGDTGERLLALPPGRWNETALLEWLEPFIGGGSSLDVPLRELPDYYVRLGAPLGDTDVLFVTDAICRIEIPIRDRFLHWKRQAKARLISLILNDKAGDLTEVSEEVHLITSLSVGEAGVERVLSL